MPSPDLRVASLDRFARAWEEAILAGHELERCFDSLGDALSSMSEFGSNQTLRFERPLVQRWWVLFQEAKGAMIPREPEMPPIPLNVE